MLVPGVRHLDPESAVFEAMLEGWALQQRTRFLKAETISSRLRLARRVAAFANEYPWEWQSSDMEAFIDSCRNRARPIDVSTGRLYETTLRMFLQYVTDPRYGWSEECVQRFGVAPTQVLHEWNTVVHVSEYEATHAGDHSPTTKCKRSSTPPMASSTASAPVTARAHWPRCGTRHC